MQTSAFTELPSPLSAFVRIWFDPLFSLHVDVLYGCPLRTSCTNVIHDLGLAEPRSNVEPSSRSADPVQLNGCGYTMDDCDWSTALSLRANYSDVTVTRSAYETVQCRLAVICSNFKLP